MVWQTSSRVTNCSTVRSQTARPSRRANGFLSRSLKRDDLPAAGSVAQNLAMATLAAKTSGRGGGSLAPSYRSAAAVRQPSPRRGRPPTLKRLGVGGEGRLDGRGVLLGLGHARQGLVQALAQQPQRLFPAPPVHRAGAALRIRRLLGRCEDRLQLMFHLLRDLSPRC